MTAHNMIRGVCSQCQMRAHWPGAKDSCPSFMALDDAERKQKRIVVTRAYNAKRRAEWRTSKRDGVDQ